MTTISTGAYLKTSGALVGKIKLFEGKRWVTIRLDDGILLSGEVLPFVHVKGKYFDGDSEAKIYQPDTRPNHIDMIMSLRQGNKQ